MQACVVRRVAALSLYRPRRGFQYSTVRASVVPETTRTKLREPAATEEFLDHLESLYPATPSSTPHTWAFVAATAFSASNLPDAVPLVFEHAAKKLAPGGPRDQLRRKIKEAIFKSGLTSGYPKAINALIKFHAAIPEDANDTELLRDLSVDIKGFNQMGQEFFEQTYGETATSVQGLLRNAYPDLERFSTIIGYGYVYGNHDVLGPVETSFMLIAALIASDVPLQITWHLNGAVRNGATKEQVRAVRQIAIEVSKKAGMQWKHEIPDLSP